MNKRFLECFAGPIRNKNTSLLPVRVPLFAWIEQHRIGNEITRDEVERIAI
jgi:hypothetical protein